MTESNDAHITDQQLLDTYYETGDNRVLGTLLQRYTLLLLGVCMKYLKNEEEAKDGVQQVFLKAIAELQKYKVSYVKSWLYMIARNYCLMKLRNNRLVTASAGEWLSDAEDRLPELEYIDKEALLSYLEDALQELNEDQKTCVTLFYLQRKSYSEISSITGQSLMQVKSCIQNGKRNLKLLINKKQKQNNG